MICENVFNPDTDLSHQQITAGNKVLEFYGSGVRWVVLFAQPQSGKCDTFYYVASECLRQEKVQRVVIFSGNPEKELGEQLKLNKEKFLEKYSGYLEDNIGLTRQQRTNVKNLIRERIDVRWGADLQKIAFDEQIHFIFGKNHILRKTRECV